MITVCAKNRLKPLFYRLKQLGPDNNTYLAQIITPKMAKLGPDNNFTAYIYISIYIYLSHSIPLSTRSGSQEGRAGRYTEFSFLSYTERGDGTLEGGHSPSTIGC